MIRNKDFRNMILLGSACTLVLSACGSFFTGKASAALLLALGALLLFLFSCYTKRRYSALEKLDRYLAGVLAGKELPEVSDQEEGEISILKSDILKATTTLKYQKELLAGDKERLAAAIADISHQLKTPLTSMMVMNDLLMSEENPDRRTEFLATQSSQLDRMNWLIQTLLKLSKLDAGTIELKQEEVPANELIEAALKPFEIQMELKELSLHIMDSDLRIRCDRNWTVEALQNIIKNCGEHMDRGGVLRIDTGDTNLFSSICISDNGCGIAEEDLPHIFERFYKGKNAGKDSVGIGLALSKTVMENQSGDILVTSKEGVGTSFELRFYKTIL